MNRTIIINRHLPVSEIVKKDYRTAAVFRRHGIHFCCGAHLPLDVACELKGENTNQILEELDRAMNNIQVSGNLRFDDWETGFLTDYIIHVHHDYLRTALPAALDLLTAFADDHAKKFDWVAELMEKFTALQSEMLSHIRYEEEIIFPYICQIEHAYSSKESYAGLFVRTLSKPVEAMMKKERDILGITLDRIRSLTNDYNIPVNACTSHKVCLLTLQELDQDLVQHMHLENNILFPKAIRMEKELMIRN